MGMFAFKLTLLFCSLTIYTLAKSASVLDNSSDSFGSWLLKEDQEVPSQQSPPLSRRITPKSIFVVPIFNRCDSGYKLDQMGHCVKMVHVDGAANEAAKLNSLLQKLITAYSPQNSQAKDAEKQDEIKKPLENGNGTKSLIEQNMKENDDAIGNSGPLQLSIPFHSKNSSEYTSEEVDTRSNTSTVLKNNIISQPTTITTTTDNIITEILNEYTTESGNIEGSTIPLGEVTLNTNYPELYTAFEDVNQPEFSTVTLETTTISDFTAIPELPITEVSSDTPPRRSYGNSYYNNVGISEANRKEEPSTVVNMIYRYTSDDILKIPIKFPESSGVKKQVDRLSSRYDTSTSFSTSTHQNKNRPFSLEDNRFTTNVNYNHNKKENAKDTYNREASKNKDNNDAVNNNNYDNLNISKNNENSDSSISSSSSINVGIHSESEVSSSISNSKNDKYQKLPSNGRNRPKCDPASGYNDCILKFNLFSPDKTSSYLLNRNPVSTYIRFPGMYTKGSSLVRFPSGQKQPMDADDAVSFAEINPGTRFWESGRYPTPYWPSWDVSKPHYVRIWPDNPMSTYNVGNVNYNSRSQTDNYT